VGTGRGGGLFEAALELLQFGHLLGIELHLDPALVGQHLSCVGVLRAPKEQGLHLHTAGRVQVLAVRPGNLHDPGSELSKQPLLVLGGLALEACEVGGVDPDSTAFHVREGLPKGHKVAGVEVHHGVGSLP